MHHLRHFLHRDRAKVLGWLVGLVVAAASPVGALVPVPGGTGIAPQEPSAAPSSSGRVIVVGFDGADWRRTERLMDEGALPNLAELRESGTAGPLISTDPAESAAGWAAINTGSNPLKNGIPSFIERQVQGDLTTPAFAHIEIVTKDTEELLADGRSGGPTAWLGGFDSRLLAGIVFLLAFAVFRLILRASTPLALVLGVALGAAAYFASRSAASALPDRIPGVFENEVELDGFWIEAARGGAPSVALEAPVAFARPGADGARTLYGLGIPDARSSVIGEWFIYTTDTVETGRAPRGDQRGGSNTGTIFRVDFEETEAGEEAIDTFVYGPVNFVELDAVRKRYAQVREIMDDSERYNALEFAESQEIRDQSAKLERTLAEFGEPVPGGARGAKTYLHRANVPMRVVRRGGAGEDASFEVTLGEQTQTLRANEWSDFYTVTFELGPGMDLHAMTRAYVKSVEPYFELYVDTLQFDPAKPAFWQPVSEPRAFSSELAELIDGRYETLGWGCLTNQVKDKLIEPAMFLEDVEFTMRYRRRLFQEMLGDDDWRVLYSVFSTTDRVQHMMYRFADPEHPAHDPDDAVREVEFFGETITYADAIDAIYRQMDAIVGEAMAALEPADTLILCADHGFTSFRRQMDVNAWLASEGYLVLREDLSSANEGGMFGAVDWSKTRAYALGLGMVYLNLEGREPHGVVTRAEAPELMAEICETFLAARDEGRVVGTSAKIMKDVYSGPAEWGTLEFHCSDIMLGFAEYYRSAWVTADGSIELTNRNAGTAEPPEIVPEAIYSDNEKPWSGDHASNDPALVSGIFFCNRKVAGEPKDFSVFDIAPTVLERLGVARPAHFDGEPLEFER